MRAYKKKDEGLDEYAAKGGAKVRCSVADPFVFDTDPGPFLGITDPDSSLDPI